MSILKPISEFFFPSRCPCCGELEPGGEPCEGCAEGLNKCVLKMPICKKCGNEKRLCACGEFNPLFTGAAAVYFNNGTAKQGVYGLKFRKRAFSAVFFGGKMAEVFSTSFPDIRPDAVCIVPTFKTDRKERDYDQVHLLARAAAKKLSLKYEPKLLKKIRKTKRQHELPKSERAANVKGAFKALASLDGKRILLVDDIKTTGHTLNECAKQLRLAGAEEVYCLTALISPNSSCK